MFQVESNTKLTFPIVSFLTNVDLGFGFDGSSSIRLCNACVLVSPSSMGEIIDDFASTGALMGKKLTRCKSETGNDKKKQNPAS